MDFIVKFDQKYKVTLAFVLSAGSFSKSMYETREAEQKLQK